MTTNRYDNLAAHPNASQSDLEPLSGYRQYQSALAFLILSLWLALWIFVLPWPGGGWLILIGAYFVADVGSYLFHVILDHHTDPARSHMAAEFQSHHEQPGSITAQPVSAILAPVAGILNAPLALLAVASIERWISPAVALAASTILLSWLFGQLFHRWAHLSQVPRGIATLQRARLIIRPEDHAAHHRAPYLRRFAVINGWSNPALDYYDAAIRIACWMKRHRLGHRRP